VLATWGQQLLSERAAPSKNHSSRPAVRPRNGAAAAAAAAAIYPTWRHIEVGADGLHTNSCINLDCHILH